MKKQEEVQKCFIGIDVSKLTIDVSIITNDGEHVYEAFGNNPKDFKQMEIWLKKRKSFNYRSALFCMEHTGLYTRELVSFLMQKQANVWMESALHMKKSMGLTRGKTDKVDSFRIARYAMTNSDMAILVKLSNVTLQKLKDLVSNRERLSRCIIKLKIAQDEFARVDKKLGRELKKINAPAMKGLKKSKAQVEKRMLELINADAELKRLFDLVTSIKCVGNVLATELLVYTDGFTRMQNNRQLACYCGVAPFEHSSGTSVRGRTRTSNFANMRLKSTLHMAAISACHYVPDLKKYFERKVAEGKNKMTVINAIRNKLLHRVVAVVNRGTPYVENYNNLNLERS